MISCLVVPLGLSAHIILSCHVPLIPFKDLLEIAPSMAGGFEKTRRISLKKLKF